jgi:hypothetical protein
MYFNASAGFDALTRLDMAQNALTGPLPPSLTQVRAPGTLQLSVYDNLLSGTLPSSYASLSWVALAYNPQLVGPLPVAFAAVKTKLYADRTLRRNCGTGARVQLARTPEPRPGHTNAGVALHRAVS